VTQRFRWRLVVFGIGAAIAAGCASPDAEIQKHAEKIESLRASAAAAAEAWLSGDASGTYTRTTLEQTFQLVDQQRAAVAGTPEDLRRLTADAVAAQSEELLRRIAALSDAVRDRDAARVRRQLADLSRQESGSP
jgi:hypothetical protein